MDLDLTDKIAIVTGSSRGLGLASARRSSRRGAAWPSAPEARSGSRRRPPSFGGGRARAGSARARRRRGLASADGRRHVIARTVETFGGLDILVNNVGLGRGASITDTSDAEWHEAFDQTLFRPSAPRAWRSPHMRRRGGGAIVMIASIWGRESGGRMTYNAVKAAEISLAKSMAQQLAGDNIRVNSVAPGSILFPGGSLAPPAAGRSGGHCGVREAGTAVRPVRPPRRGRGGRGVSRRRLARAGSAGQVCPLTAASHAP